MRSPIDYKKIARNPINKGFSQFLFSDFFQNVSKTYQKNIAPVLTDGSDGAR